MKKTPIYSIVNKKGGVGKTTSTCAIASICAYFGARVLVVDLDPQINTTTIFYKDIPEMTITDILLKRREEVTYSFVKSVIQQSEYPNIDILPGDDNLDDEGDKILLRNATINDRGEIDINKNAIKLLTKAFDLVSSDYDLILIDNTPYFNIISKNALSASDGVLIPVQNDGFSYAGLTKLLQKIYDVKSEVNEKLDIIGVFFTDVNERTNVFKQLRELFKTDLKDKLLNTYIRRDVAADESNSLLVPLFHYSKNTNATIDYMYMVQELHLLNEDNHKKLIHELDKYYKNYPNKKRSREVI